MALKWVFSADTRPFRQSLASMRSEVQAFSGGIRSQLASAFGTVALVAWGKAMLDQAGRVDDLAKRLDMSAESVQRIGYAAEQAGSGVEVAAKGLTTMTKNLAAAEDGTADLADATGYLGTTVEELRELSPEDQLVTLAAGYAAAEDKGKALAAVMKLTGKAGAEMIPLLADGPDVLRQKLEEATVASDSQIATIAKIGDEMDRLKSMSLSAFADIITGFKTMGAYGAWALNAMFNGMEMANDRLDDTLSKIINGESGGSAKKSKQDAEESAAELNKTIEEREKLSEQIAKLEEEAAMRRLSVEEQITKLKKEQADLRATATFEGLTGGDTDASLSARKRELEITREIEQLQKQANDDAAAAAEEQTRKAEEIESLRAREAELDREQRLSTMTDAQKLTELRKEQAGYMKQAEEARKRGDEKGALEARIKAKELNPEIAALSRPAAPAMPTVIADDLRKIGGGGGAVLSTMNPQAGVETRLDRVVNVLTSIDRKTTQGSTTRAQPF